MEKVEFHLSKWGKKLVWVPAVVAILMPFYFLHLEKELRFFKKNALSYKRFVEASFETPDGAFSSMPAQLKNIPFGEKTGVVLGSRTLDIRGVSNPYNASIIKKDSGGYQLFFRYDLIDEAVRGGLTAYIGYAELDSDFNQTEKEFIKINTHSQHAEDPRAFKADGKLFLVYNDLVPDHFADKRIMCMGEVDIDHQKLKNVMKFDPHLQGLEKNWVPFEYTDKNRESAIYFEYSVSPLKILKVSPQETGFLTHLPSTYNRNLEGLLWPGIWGQLRGGTSAQRVDDQYLAFFHSSFKDKNGIIWYSMGAYTFEENPPFRITGMSSYPILFDEIYSTPAMNTADPMKRVIFPSGFVVEEREGREVVQLSCGENDSSVKVVTLDKEKLLKSLKKIKLTKGTY